MHERSGDSSDVQTVPHIGDSALLCLGGGTIHDFDEAVSELKLNGIS